MDKNITHLMGLVVQVSTRVGFNVHCTHILIMAIDKYYILKVLEEIYDYIMFLTCCYSCIMTMKQQKGNNNNMQKITIDKYDSLIA